MYYVYLVKQSNGTIYIGFSGNLKQRIKDHKYKKKIQGLIYYEAFQNKKDALEREKQLKKYKSAWGYLKKRIQRSTKELTKESV